MFLKINKTIGAAWVAIAFCSILIGIALSGDSMGCPGFAKISFVVDVLVVLSLLAIVIHEIWTK